MHSDTRTMHYKGRAGDAEHELRLVPVAGTAGRPYLFGGEPNRRPIEQLFRSEGGGAAPRCLPQVANLIVEPPRKPQ